MKKLFAAANRRSYFLILMLAFGFMGSRILTACSEGGGVNIFSVDDDIKLGLQLDQEIKANPTEYPLLDETQYATSYAHLRRITNALLATGKITHKDQFVWQIKIIKRDDILNAFCAPGGYIYVYTGLIKYLDKESEFAGVLGHEIAHADLRHATDKMTEQYGLQLLLDVVLGKNQSQLTQIAAGLATLAYSRSNETQADEYSVDYLCGTEYDARGTAGFFEKLIASGQAGNTPAFLSTHPNPDNRVQNINANATELACSGAGTFDTRYAEFKNSLP